VTGRIRAGEERVHDTSAVADVIDETIVCALESLAKVSL